MQIAVEFFFQAAQSVVVDAHVAQHLRGDLVVGIEALKLLLEVNALHIEGLHRGRNLRRHAARDPGKVVPGIQARGNLVFVVNASSGSVCTSAASVRAAAGLSAISVGSA